MEVLIEAGADINKPGAWEFSPLMYAAIFGHEDMVRLLIKSGAKIDAVDKHGKTALDHARLEQHHAVIEMLSVGVNGQILGTATHIIDVEGHETSETSFTLGVSQSGGRLKSESGYDITEMSKKEVERAVLANNLDKLCKDVALNHGTERAFSGKTPNGYRYDDPTAGTLFCYCLLDSVCFGIVDANTLYLIFVNSVC